ncbi:MAG: hypothetical protein AAFP22_17145, partial [Planctomycetota bacterium]
MDRRASTRPPISALSLARSVALAAAAALGACGGSPEASDPPADSNTVASAPGAGAEASGQEPRMPKRAPEGAAGTPVTAAAPSPEVHDPAV